MTAEERKSSLPLAKSYRDTRGVKRVLWQEKGSERVPENLDLFERCVLAFLSLPFVLSLGFGIQTKPMVFSLL